MARLKPKQKFVSLFLEQFKNIFKKPKQPTAADFRETQSKKETINKSHTDISKSIREFNKFQVQKNSWRNLFHYK